MRTINHSLLTMIALAGLGLPAAAQGPAFTYQGRLNDGANPSNGNYDLRFTIYDAITNGGAVAGPLTMSPTFVSNGLFTVTLDFGAGVFTGADRWLDIAVRPTGGGAFTTLAPRQEITATPYAQLAGAVPDGTIGTTALAAGAVTTDKLADGSVTAAQLAKAPRAGTIPSASMAWGFDRAAFRVDFSPPFPTAPVVTLAAEGGGPGDAALRTRSSQEFVGQWTPNDRPNPVAVDAYGQFPSMVLVNGNPAVCYYFVGSGRLQYRRALDALGTSWGPALSLDAASVWSTSMQIVNGKPAVCYYDIAVGALRYVRANDADGTTWGAPITVDAAGNAGGWNSMAVVNGRPAISYYGAGSADLKFVRAADADGAGWNVPVLVDTNGFVGQYTCLAVVNGRPATSYQDANTFRLRYVRALDADGTTWGTPVQPDATGGAATSLAVVDGAPAICHYSGGGAQLRYVRATDADGAFWGAPLLVDSGLGLDYTSLILVGGHPAIAYAGGKLRYVRALDATGGAWGVSVDVARSASASYRAPLLEVGGQPAVAYFDPGDVQLKYLRQGSAAVPALVVNWIALEP
ncbi:MAG: hypothetical protein IT579_21415 [Verrucomicrobia subdivision 3 bacterium]|nr:hypothetical protein [Limisphaerales bacterium]